MRIELLGASFSIQTDEDPTYLAKVVDLYKQKVAEIQRSVSTQDTLKVAILAGILTADAYLKKSGATDADSAQLSLITAKLIDELGEALEGESENGNDPPSDLDF